MRSVFSILGSPRMLAVGMLVVLLSIGCSKHEDDCSAPASNDPDTSTRQSIAEDGNAAAEDSRPSPAGHRGAEDTTDEMDTGGISDDGDDEADGEGNKKNRPLH